MVGAYICFSLTVEFQIPFPIAFLLTLCFSVVLGLAIERLVLRPLIGEPIISVIMVTVGLSTVLKSLVQVFWGTQIQVFPPVLPQEPVFIAGLPVSPVYLAAFGLSLLLFAVFSLFFKFSRLGVAMRATAYDQQAAASMGIGIKGIFALSWCIAAVVSSIGGVILGNINASTRSWATWGSRFFRRSFWAGWTACWARPWVDCSSACWKTCATAWPRIFWA